MLCVRGAMWIILLAVGCFTMVDRVYGSDKPEDKLVGLWGYEQVLGPLARGELTIDVRGTEWCARMAGFEAPVAHSSNDIRFALPDGQGDFRGRLSKDSKTIQGYWIQSNKGIFDQRYTTPVMLFAAGASVWNGEVHPLEERISFYVSIQRAAD